MTFTYDLTAGINKMATLQRAVLWSLETEFSRVSSCSDKISQVVLPNTCNLPATSKETDRKSSAQESSGTQSLKKTNRNIH